jgi:aminoglycoside phosphotransferase (APT) family kinase protein
MTSEPTAPPGPAWDPARSAEPTGQPAAVTDGLVQHVGVDVPAVSAWLEANVAGAVAPFSFELIAGGHSNLTYRVVGEDGHALVLRRPPLGHLLASAHDMGREHRVIAALARTPVPVAPARGFCADVDVSGAPFYIMDFVEGHVIRDRVAAETLLEPAARATAGTDLVDTLAAIHAVDIEAVGLADLGRHEGYIARQLKRWYGQWQQSQTRPLRAVDEVHDLLSSQIPEQGPACIVHGDYRLDNTILHPTVPGRIVAVLDWEMSTLGDPLTDLGTLLAYWSEATDDAVLAAARVMAPVTAADGFPSRAEVVERYAARTGFDVSGIEWYQAFAYFKLAVVCQGIAARAAGGAMLGSGFDEAQRIVAPLVAAGRQVLGIS